MLVHIVADHHVRRGAAGHQSGQAGQNLFQGVGVQPVVAVHYLIVQACGVADALIHTLAVAAVFLMDGLDDGGIFGDVLVADGGGIVLHGTVVHKDDLGLLSGRKQGLDAMAHICRRVVARNGKGDEFLLHKMIAPFSINSRRTKNAGHGVMCSYYIIFAPEKLSFAKKLPLTFRAFCRKNGSAPAQKPGFCGILIWF